MKRTKLNVALAAPMALAMLMALAACSNDRHDNDRPPDRERRDSDRYDQSRESDRPTDRERRDSDRHDQARESDRFSGDR